jgi:hypothetical protein
LCPNGSAALLTWSLRIGCTSKFALSPYMVICKTILHSLSCLLLSILSFRESTSIPAEVEIRLRGGADHESLTASLTLHLLSCPVLHYASFPAPRVAEDTHRYQDRETDMRTYRWVYLFFFNTLWVWIPLWILYQGYGAFTSALNPTTSKQKKR